VGLSLESNLSGERPTAPSAGRRNEIDKVESTRRPTAPQSDAASDREEGPTT